MAKFHRKTVCSHKLLNAWRAVPDLGWALWIIRANVLYSSQGLAIIAQTGQQTLARASLPEGWPTRRGVARSKAPSQRERTLPRYALPLARPGQVIGLLGGSFDPPHEGHVHISREALRRFGLDQVWWLVSPGNPLKDHGPAAMAKRMATARALLHHPRLHVSDLEAQIGSRHTAQTLAALQAARPDLRFVWLMGADNLVQFDRWQHWHEIMLRVPVGILARPGLRLDARNAKAARVFRQARLPARESRRLGRREPPTWCFLNIPMKEISSTRLRQDGTGRKALER